MTVILSNLCGICGRTVQSRVPSNWHPSKLARRAEQDMQAHLLTHSLAELLRYEIRRDLDLVPDEQRATIVRDVYRELLGATRDGQYALHEADGHGVYAIDEVLGGAGLYRLWLSADRCADPRCRQHVAD